MNHIYRLVFNRTLGCTQAAPETARAHGKGDSGKAAKVCAGGAALALLCATPLALAGDTFIDSTGNTVIGTGGGTYGSPWNVGGWLFVGDYATGDLTISNGGQVSNGLSSIGDSNGANGPVTGTGSGSTWTNSGTLRIGYNGTGKLIIENGGQVSSQEGRLGVQASSSAGTVTVTGAGSQWTTNGNVLRVGQYGTGTLIIANGGTVLSGAGFIGEQASSTGSSVTVTGGGNWTSTEVSLNRGGVLNIGNYNGSDTAGTVTTGRIFYGGAGTRGAVNFNQTDNIIFATPIEGNVSVYQRGSGKTTFTTNQAYTNGTFIDSGTLALSGSGSIANSTGVQLANTLGATFDISDVTASATIKTLNGGGAAGGNIVLGSKTLVVALDGTSYYDGVISGTGGLTKSNAGTLRLTGNHTYTGGTSILGGTLLVGAGGTTGSITGDVTNNAALVFNRSDALTFSGVVSGSGTLGKQGAGTLTLTGNSTYSGGTTISGGALQIGNGGASGSISGDVTNNAALVFNRSTSLTFADVISGSGTLEKQGAGTLMLTGNNTYTGGTTISGGKLVLFGSGSIAASSGVTLANTVGVEFDISGVSTSGASIQALNGGGTTGGNVYLGAKTLTIDGGGTYAGVIDGGAGSLVKTGTDTLTLTGGNTYAGLTTISNGTLQIGNGGTSGSISGIGSVINNAALIFNRSNDMTFAGAIGGSGTLEKQGAGMLTLTGANSYSGGTTISGGTLQIGNNSTSGSISGDVTNNAALIFSRSDALTFAGDISGTGTLEKQGAGTLTLTGSNTHSGGTTISNGTLQIGDNSTSGSISGDVTNNAALIFNRSDALTFAGDISGTGTLEKQGAGTLTLTGDNTHSGGTTISNGTLQIGNNSTSGSISGNVTNNAALIFNRSDITSFAGTISGTGTLEKQGTDVLTLTGASTYTGLTTISDGTLLLSGSGSITASSGVTLADTAGAWLDIFHTTSGATIKALNGGGTSGGNVSLGNQALTIDGGGTYAGMISGLGGSLVKTGTDTLTLTGNDNFYLGGTTISAGTLQIGNGGTTGAIVGNVTNNAALIFNRSDALTFAGDISGSGTLEKQGAGTLTLTGDNTHSGGTTISNGTLQIGNGGASGSISGDVTNNAALIFSRSNAQTFAGDISGSGTLEKQGADTLTLTGDNTYSGGTTISSGTLRIGDGSTAGAIVGDVANSGALIFDRSDALNFGGEISGSGSVTQAGAGVLTLTGVNTYTGTTTVAGGKLAVNGAIAASAVTVQSGGTLGGSGTVGATTVQSGGHLAPGNSVGTLNVAGDLTLAAGSHLDFELGSPGTSASPAAGISDRIVVSGDLDFNGTVNLAQSTDAADGTAALGYYRLITYGGALLANTATIGATPGLGGAVYALQAGANRVDLFVGSIGDNSLQHWQGGDGTWNTSGTQWLNQGGTAPAAWAGTHAVFKDAGGFTGGTITIDGVQSVQGIQFVDAGYRLEGAGTLMTDPAGSELRVLADSATIATAIAGTGGIVKTQAGTLILTGANTYTGGTTISGGTLQIGDGGTSGAIVGNVANNGALVFNRSDATSFAGVVSGSGSLEKQGAGMLTLTGDNTHSGGTTISNGTLKIGDGGTTGSIAGNIANNAALIFDRSDATSFAGIVSGNGTLEKQGVGMLTLTGNNTHSGGTTIGGGTLQIGNGGTAGAIGGDVANNAALIFNRSDALTFAGNISGTGTLEKQGTGTLTLTGNNTYSGATTVSGGTLLVNGSSANSAVAIGSGGTLGGSGTVGKVTVNSGGTLAPGNSPGLLTVNGDLILNAGSTTRMEINGTARGTDYDAIDVAGNAALDGTLDLAFGYVPTNGTSFKLIDATGGISGNFASVTSSNLGAGLLATSVIDPTTFNILISLAQQSYVDVSGPLTANQRAVAINLDTFSTSGQAADLIAALNTLSAGDLPPAFDALSGVEHSFVAPLAFGAARQLHGLLGARGASLGARGAAQRAAFAGAQLAHAGSLSGLFDGERNDGVQDGFWLRALASDGRIDRDRNASGADLSGGGLALGADRRLNADWLAGLAFAYGASKADAQHGTINLDSYQLAAYARWQGAQYYVDGSLAFGRHRADSVRKMAFLNQRAKAKYDADSASFALEAGRPSERGQAVLTPFVGLEGQILRREGFTESGAGGANLKVKGRTDDSLRAIVGARYAWQGTRFAPSVEAAWVHAFGDEKARIDARFAAVPTASAFTALGPKQNRDRLRLGVGLTAWASKNARLDIAYQGEFARSDREHAATATLRWVW